MSSVLFFLPLLFSEVLIAPCFVIHGWVDLGFLFSGSLASFSLSSVSNFPFFFFFFIVMYEFKREREKESCNYMLSCSIIVVLPMILSIHIFSL